MDQAIAQAFTQGYNDGLPTAIKLLTASMDRMSVNISKFLGGTFGMNPSTTGMLTYGLASSVIGQALGMDNPLRTQAAYKSISESLYNARNPAAITSTLHVADKMRSYHQATQAMTSDSVFTMRPGKQAELAARMLEGGLLSNKEFNNIGMKDSSGFQKMRSAESAATAADKLLGISDIGDALNVTNIIGGTQNIKDNSRIFKEYISTLVQEGVSMGEMMKSVEDNLQLNKALRMRGFSASMAAGIANQSRFIDAEAKRAKQEGRSFDTTDAKNAITAISAEYRQDEGFETMTAFAAGEFIDDKTKRTEFYEKLRAAKGDSKKMSSILESYGVRDLQQTIYNANKNRREELILEGDAAKYASQTEADILNDRMTDMMNRQAEDAIVGKATSYINDPRLRKHLFRGQAEAVRNAYKHISETNMSELDVNNTVARAIKATEGKFDDTMKIETSSDWNQRVEDIKTLTGKDAFSATSFGSDEEFDKWYTDTHKGTTAEDAKRVRESMRNLVKVKENDDAMVTGMTSAGNMLAVGKDNQIQMLTNEDIQKATAVAKRESSEPANEALSSLGTFMEDLIKSLDPNSMKTLNSTASQILDTIKKQAPTSA